MNLYIWREVLSDWNFGIAFAMANSEEEARLLIIKNADDYQRPYLEKELLAKPDIFSSPHGESIPGGS